ncbi:MAG: hypothetical protein N2318_13270 [Meiothermus sp.]|nr:hypothetical protein [Meiothermus sp.]
MKLQLPETLLTQPVETPTGLTQGVPLDTTQLDPILTEAVESQPEQPAQPELEPTQTEPLKAAKAKPTENTMKSAKPLPWVGIALAALAAVVAVASQGAGAYGSPTLRAEQPHTPQPAGGNRGIVWE